MFNCLDAGGNQYLSPETLHGSTRVNFTISVLDSWRLHCISKVLKRTELLRIPSLDFQNRGQTRCFEKTAADAEDSQCTGGRLGNIDTRASTILMPYTSLTVLMLCSLVSRFILYRWQRTSRAEAEIGCPAIKLCFFS